VGGGVGGGGGGGGDDKLRNEKKFERGNHFHQYGQLSARQNRKGAKRDQEGGVDKKKKPDVLVGIQVKASPFIGKGKEDVGYSLPK